MLKNNNKLAVFILGVAVGAVAVSVMRTASFKKACAKTLGASMRLKEEAAAFIETVKEDAQDIVAEAEYHKDSK